MLTWTTTQEPLADAILEAAELILGVELPATYRALAQRYPGGYPERANDIEVRHGSSSWKSCVGVLLSLDPRHSDSVYFHLRGQGSEGGLPAGVVPIADDGGGDLVCLDYRASSDEPSVVYWAHEFGGIEGLVPLADTFGEFLDLLGGEHGG